MRAQRRQQIGANRAKPVSATAAVDAADRENYRAQVMEQAPEPGGTVNNAIGHGVYFHFDIVNQPGTPPDNNFSLLIPGRSRTSVTAGDYPVSYTHLRA